MHPTTSQPSPDLFATLYRTLLENPADQVVGLHISSKLSGTLQSAHLAAQDFDATRMHLVDTESVSGGLQLLVRAALDDIAAGDDAATVAAKTTKRRSRVTILFLLDTLTYLHRGGRIGRAQAFVGGLLSVKPVLTVHDGEVAPLARVRSRTKGIEHDHRRGAQVRAVCPARGVSRGRTGLDDRVGNTTPRGCAGNQRRRWAHRAGCRRVLRTRGRRSCLPRRRLSGQGCHDVRTVSPHQDFSIVTPNHVALDLDLPLSRIVGIGPRQAQRLEKLGLRTIRDLLFHLPRRYEDTRQTVPLRELQAGVAQTARVRIRNISARRSQYKKMILVEATLEDDGVVANAVWFNQPFLTRQLQPGMELMVQRQGRDVAHRAHLSQPNLRAHRHR